MESLAGAAVGADFGRISQARTASTEAKRRLCEQQLNMDQSNPYQANHYQALRSKARHLRLPKYSDLQSKAAQLFSFRILIQ
ncbi:hypothetical protein RvY_06602 [Ramazzottius varieornatus]|uniref:Uncharacterized protein n=1 Tax=Ramazzottius varieornatus TaxID=947166 RepID=A0A1D1V7U7_RAMVA|nr:hypothetical protein RvY_06602 [Ramazzottius varieornatus]